MSTEHQAVFHFGRQTPLPQRVLRIGARTATRFQRVRHLRPGSLTLAKLAFIIVIVILAAVKRFNPSPFNF